MYRIEWKKEIPQFALLFVLLLAPCLLYRHLPSQLPVHWNFKGIADHYVEKSVLSALTLPLMTMGIYFLMLLLPFIDPKRQRYSDFLGTYRIIRLSIVLFLVGIASIVYCQSLGIDVPLNRIVPGIVSLLIVVIGNFMGKIRQNWFIGIRLPWTIENENVWNKTHRLGGKLFVMAGICGLIGTFLQLSIRYFLLIIPLLISIIITFVYSYVLYKKGLAEKTTAQNF